jgi:hypothetical protein
MSLSGFADNSAGPVLRWRLPTAIWLSEVRVRCWDGRGPRADGRGCVAVRVKTPAGRSGRATHGSTVVGCNRSSQLRSPLALPPQSAPWLVSACGWQPLSPWSDGGGHAPPARSARRRMTPRRRSPAHDPLPSRDYPPVRKRIWQTAMARSRRDEPAPCRAPARRKQPGVEVRRRPRREATRRPLDDDPSNRW